MANGTGPGERLPWLEPAARPAPMPRAARRAKTPLLVLLALFVGGGIAVMAFLAGRSTAPVTPNLSVPVAATPSAAPPQRRTAERVATTTPTPTVPAPVAPVAPVAASQPSPEPRATSTPVRAAVEPRPAARAKPPSPPSVRVSQGVRVHRNTPRARQYRWPSTTLGRPSGRVVQLGAYRSRAEVEAAWIRLHRAYPYLGRLPRRVTVVGPAPGRPAYYRLRVGARSARGARGLCIELHRRGRGCIVV